MMFKNDLRSVSQGPNSTAKLMKEQKTKDKASHTASTLLTLWQHDVIYLYSNTAGNNDGECAITPCEESGPRQWDQFYRYAGGSHPVFYLQTHSSLRDQPQSENGPGQKRAGAQVLDTCNYASELLKRGQLTPLTFIAKETEFIRR